MPRVCAKLTLQHIVLYTGPGMPSHSGRLFDLSRAFGEKAASSTDAKPMHMVRRRSCFTVCHNRRVASCTQRRPGILFVSIRTPELCTCVYRLLLVGSALALAGLVLPAAAVALGFAGSVLVVAGFAPDLVRLGFGLAGLVLLLAGLAVAVAHFVNTAAGLAPALADVVLLPPGSALVHLLRRDLSRVATLSQHQLLCRQALLVDLSLRRQVRPNRTLHDRCVPRVPHEEDGSLSMPLLPLIHAG